MKHILFQGDSITDADRNRTWEIDLGKGYPMLAASELAYRQPGCYTFTNRGISGNRIVDLYARIKCDLINLKPDVVSILIGVNDVGHEFSSKNGVSAEKYYTVYDLMIQEILAALPNVKIMIMEPFVLKGMYTQENWDIFYAEVCARAKKAKLIAEKYGLVYIPLQQAFLDAAASSCDEDWLRDGVHPTPAGHELIKRAWLKAFATCANP